jgi:methylmalonyl-CoA/ethylmalonyl-CoA epimerase
MNLRYSHVDILVENLEAATSFYERLLGFKRSELHEWKRDDFHVKYYVLTNELQKFMLVHPISGNLRELLDRKGEGTIYRFCFKTDDIVGAYRHALAAGVQPVNENDEPIAEADLNTPAGIRIFWLPKQFGELSMEVLEDPSE